MSKQVLLVSVRPEYADKLLKGIKTIELRKIKPKLQAGDTLVIYATSPIKAVVGTCKVESVISDTPCKLWKKVNRELGISKNNFDAYYEDHDIAFGIVCSSPKVMKQPIGLDDLRRKWQNFSPPQSYRYLNAVEMDRLEKWGEGTNNICNYDQGFLSSAE